MFSCFLCKSKWHRYALVRGIQAKESPCARTIVHLFPNRPHDRAFEPRAMLETRQSRLCAGRAAFGASRVARGRERERGGKEGNRKSREEAKKKKKKKPGASPGLEFLAEEVGFEPTVPLSTTVFKTAALNHSAIPPCCVRGRDNARDGIKA